MLRFLVWSVLFFTGTSSEIRSLTESKIVLPFASSNYGFDFIHNFTKYLHDIHRFNSFVTFAQPGFHFRPHFLVVRSVEQALIEDFNVPIIVWGTERRAKLRNNIGLNNLVFVQFTNVTDPILDVVDHTLKGLHFIPMLFFYRGKNNIPPSADEIHAFFAWCWSKNMVNVYLTFQVISKRNKSDSTDQTIQNHVFNYSPFPKLTVFNLTEKVRKGNVSFAVDRVKNVNGYTFKTLLPYHPPWSFLVPKSESCIKSGNCQHNITGRSGRLYAEYIKFIGGTMDVAVYFNLSLLQTRQNITLAAARKEVDISIFPFSDLLLSPELVEGSYPIAQTNVCIMVPVQREMPPDLYILHAFQPMLWMIVTLTFVTLLALQYIYGYGRGPFSRNPVTLFGYALLSTASVMLNQAPTIGFFRARSSYSKLNNLVILIMAFVLSNTYIASLTSLVTTTPFGTQIDTVDEFLASGLEILVMPGEREVFFDANFLSPKLKNRLRLVDVRSFARHFHNLNTSYAYLATEAIWPMVNFQQRHLNKPLFRIPGEELCTAQFFLKMPLQWDSPFLNSLTLFFMLTHESGLSLKWADMAYHEFRKIIASHIAFKRPLNDKPPFEPLCLEHFFLAGKFVFVIWILATVVFIVEISWYSLKEKRNPKNKKEVENHLRRIITTKAGKYYRRKAEIFYRK